MAADKEQPVSWRDVHKRKNAALLYAEDLGPQGTTADFEIRESGLVEVSDGDSVTPMPWISTGRGKKLGLNRTNCKVLETLAGTDDYRRWRGWITLVVVRTKYKDRKSGMRLETNAIRVSDQRPNRKPSGPAPSGAAAPPITPEEQAAIERAERKGGA